MGHGGQSHLATRSARSNSKNQERPNGYLGATPEREEASTKSQLARGSWVQMAEKLMPSVSAWEQERWDIQLAPCFIVPEEEEEDQNEEDMDEEKTRLQQNFKEFAKEFVEQQLKRSKSKSQEW